MTNKEYYEKRDRWMQEMFLEMGRVCEILENHGYEMSARVNYEECDQFFKFDLYNPDGTISHFYFSCPKKENFKPVLKWMLARTKFSEVTAYAKWTKRIPTFYSADDVEANYDYYFDTEKYFRELAERNRNGRH